MDLGATPLSFTSSSCSWKSAGVVADKFPAGLRVLVVDDDPTCLRILEKMLKNCLYEVTTCNRAELALKYLRDNKNGYDVVISDVHMPDMDGFKLLERVGLEMDLPVIMMSADDGKNVVMKGITHGACDYLIKPVRMEALKNIWQHVVRKKRHEWREKDFEQSGTGSVEEGERQQKAVEDVDYSSSVNEGNWKSNSKKRKDEEDEADERDDTSTLKKPRVVWSVELHQQFVTAVNQLGIDKAVPKKILELMNVPGLTRENVASHLQKYRLYLRRLSGVSQHQNGLGPSFMGPTDTPFGPISSLTGVDLQALAASGQLPPQSLATIQAAALGRPGPATKSPLVDQRNIFSFENPKLRFVDGPTLPPPQQQPQQQQINNTKQVNLLHGIPTNMDSKQLANLHQSAQHYGGPMLTQMVQPQQRTQILSEVNGNQSQPILSQVIPSIGVRGPPPYAAVSHPSPVVDFSRGQSQGNNSCSPNYDVFSELNQHRSPEWRLQNPGPSFEAPQGLVQQPFTSNQKTGQNITHQASSSVAENTLRIKTEKLPDMGFQNGVFGEHFGQDDLMSAILKQQQEGGMGPVENEFGFDGYHLGNLPV